MSIESDNFPDDVYELKELLRLSRLKIEHLAEEVAILTNRLFGSKSEKICDRDDKQLRLFDATENPPEEANEPDEIYLLSQKKAKPILKEIKNYLTKKRAYVTPENLAGNAINYTLNQWDRLENYIKDGNDKIDNNLVENAVRPFAVGRKNWLFSGNQAGVRASALLYSLIGTARANGLEPYAYFRFLLEKLPTTPPEKMATLLPTRMKAEDLKLAKQHRVV